jgi:hypothetical protein
VKYQVWFYDGQHKLITTNVADAPPGAAHISVEFVPELLMPGEEMIKLTPDEVKQFEDALADRLEPSQETWHHRHGVPVEPLKDEIIFGADSREVLPGERPLHPLTSQCRCGRQITRLTGDGAWEHSD